MRRKAQLWWIWAAVVVIASTALVDAQAPQTEELIKSLNFQNADIHSVLNFLAEYASVNIVATPGVTGSVTFNLQNVTWDQALEIVTKTYGLTAVQEEGYIRIVPTEEYQLERAANAKSNVEHQMLVPLVTEVKKVGYAAAEELVDPVKSLMTERGSVDADKRTNSLIIREVPDNMPNLVEFINTLDRPIDQIKISAKLVEISTEDLLELGIDWSVTGNFTWDGEPGSATYNQNTDRVADPAGQFLFQAMPYNTSLDAQISALSQTGKAKVVAHPEITTVDNNEARIQLGQKIPIKQFDEAGNVVIEFTEVGTILRVTPHITAEDKILMHLYPERSTYQFDPNGVIINTSNAETKVVVENGQTVVIGGLTTQDVIEAHTGVPILKDIPLLGYLFSFKQRKTVDRDLVIFVTPAVVDDQDMTMHSSVTPEPSADLN